MSEGLLMLIITMAFLAFIFGLLVYIIWAEVCDDREERKLLENDSDH